MPKVRKTVKLSKSVLEMKFMKRTKLRIQAENEAEEGQEMYQKEISSEMKSAVDKFIIEPSFVPMQDLVVNRISYGGFNAEVEKFMTPSGEKKDSPSEPDEITKDVSDEEMSKSFGSLRQRMGQKFAGKRRRQFMKPKE